MTYSVSKTFRFCYGHRLLNDPGKCKNIHGHTAKVTIHLEKDSVDENGMVVHFENLKKTIGGWISKNLDHTLIISSRDPIKKYLDEQKERYLALDSNPTAEMIARFIFDQAKSMGLPVARVDLWESESSKATYRV